MPTLRFLPVIFLLGLAPLASHAAAAADATADAPKPLSRAEQSLRDAELRRFAAMVARDVPALDKALASDLSYVHSSGAVQGKNELLRDVESGAITYRRLEASEQRIRLHGNVGIITGIVTMSTAAAAGEREQRLRYTDIYVRRAGRWQLLAWQSTRMPDAN